MRLVLARNWTDGTFMPEIIPHERKVEEIRQMVEFLLPSQICAFEPPEGYCLVGDNHIQRGSPFVIGGAPGVGKSRAATKLAICGATCGNFFGMQVHQRFRTMILQCENGRVRLKSEYGSCTDAALDEFVRVSPPPPFGFAFDDIEFLAQLKRQADDFSPDVFLLDPWNRLARDEKGKDYREAFERILSVLPTGDKMPAVGIVAHTRKPSHNERANGRGLLQTLSGSYLLGSIPRNVFVMQADSDDVEDQRRVWTCCKTTMVRKESGARGVGSNLTSLLSRNLIGKNLTDEMIRSGRLLPPLTWRKYSRKACRSPEKKRLRR